MVEPTTDIPEQVTLAFAAIGVTPTSYAHDEVATVEAQGAVLGSLPGTLTKNMFLRDKKHGLFLLTVKADREVNMKSVAAMLKLSGANLRFGDEELLMAKLGVVRGSVSPLAVVTDVEGDVKFAIDKALLRAEIVNVHPMRHDRTTALAPADLVKYVTHAKHEPIELDFDSAPSPAAAPAKGKKDPKPQKAKKEAPKKGETLLAATVTKNEDFGLWYTQTLKLSEMIDYSDVSGCYILRPWSYHIWEEIQSWFDGEIKKLGVKNAYFPLFVPKSALEKEKDHVEGFAPEVAWVTKSGEKDLPEPIAVRPTSETAMYPFFAKWIKSHRDLPLKLNQWCNVVRWEFKDATPFLRSREFLWQEGHTAHSSYEDCQDMVLKILDLYRRVYEELLAVPVIPGIKTEAEKFAGGQHTHTVEGYINGSGRAIQGATSHNLGQNFGKMFEITYEDDSGKKQIPWQASWGLTTRSIGVCVMVHGDDKGLVLPPRVAPVQAVLLPIYKKGGAEYEEFVAYCEAIKTDLEAVGVRVEIDSRRNYTPGWKFAHWEQKGVPLRLEVGARDMEKRSVVIVRRDTGAKQDTFVSDVAAVIPTLLSTIQADLFDKAKCGRDEKIVEVTEWKDFVPALEQQCLVLTPFCDEEEWEDKVKEMSRAEALNGAEEEATCATSVAAKTLCKPDKHPLTGKPMELPEGAVCFTSGKPAKAWVLWGRSY